MSPILTHDSTQKLYGDEQAIKTAPQHFCHAPDWRTVSQTLRKQRGGGTDGSVEQKIVGNFRQAQPASAVGTLLIEWVETVCYNNMPYGMWQDELQLDTELQIGFRECPFFLFNCF